MNTPVKKNKNIKLDKKVVLFLALWLTIGGLVGIGFFIVVYLTEFEIDINKSLDSTVMGTFGDFIGGFFGTIFSLVTVFLIWLAYQSQKKELKILGKQGKTQTTIQALTALISIEMTQLEILNQQLLEEKNSRSPYFTARIQSKITATQETIDKYKKQLTDILEQQNTVTPTVIIKPKKKNKFIRLLKYYFKCFWRLLFPPFK